MVSAIILGVGLLVVALVLVLPARRRESAARGLKVGDDSTRVLAALGARPTRCPGGSLDHLVDEFPATLPRPTREQEVAKLQGETRARWLYPGKGGCQPRNGDAEIGLDASGRVLWVVPSTARVPLVLPDSL